MSRAPWNNVSDGNSRWLCIAGMVALKLRTAGSEQPGILNFVVLGNKHNIESDNGTQKFGFLCIACRVCDTNIRDYDPTDDAGCSKVLSKYFDVMIVMYSYFVCHFFNIDPKQHKGGIKNEFCV